MAEPSAVGGAALLVAIAIYQTALALGAPWGEPAFSSHPSQGLLTGLTWFIGGYLLVDALANLGSASVMKRWVGGATKVAISMCCIAVATTS